MVALVLVVHPNLRRLNPSVLSLGKQTAGGLEAKWEEESFLRDSNAALCCTEGELWSSSAQESGCCLQRRWRRSKPQPGSGHGGGQARPQTSNSTGPLYCRNQDDRGFSSSDEGCLLGRCRQHCLQKWSSGFTTDTRGYVLRQRQRLQGFRIQRPLRPAREPAQTEQT